MRTDDFTSAGRSKNAVAAAEASEIVEGSTLWWVMMKKPISSQALKRGEGKRSEGMKEGRDEAGRGTERKGGGRTHFLMACATACLPSTD